MGNGHSHSDGHGTAGQDLRAGKPLTNDTAPFSAWWE